MIFNEKMYSWGVGWGAQASIDREFDALSVKVPAGNTTAVVDTFTIQLLPGDTSTLNHLVLSWDNTQVKVPLSQ